MNWKQGKREETLEKKVNRQSKNAKEEKKKTQTNKKAEHISKWREDPFLPHSCLFLTSLQLYMHPVFVPTSFSPCSFESRKYYGTERSTGLLQEDAYLSWGFLTLFWGLLLWDPWDVISTIFPLPSIKKWGLDCPLGITQTSHHVIIREYLPVLWKDFLILPLIEWMSPHFRS